MNILLKIITLFSIFGLLSCECKIPTTTSSSSGVTETTAQGSFDINELEKEKALAEKDDGCKKEDKNKIDPEKPFKLQGGDSGCDTK